MVFDGIATDKRRIQDSDGDSLRLDGEGRITAKDPVYDMIEEGEQVIVSFDTHSLANGSVITLGISTCSLHFMDGYYEVSTTGTIEVEFFEAATYTGGSALTLFNRHRPTAVPCSEATLVSNPTVTDAGLLLESSHLADKKLSGNATQRSWILKQSTKYVIVVTNESGGAININLSYTWHEE